MIIILETFFVFLISLIFFLFIEFFKYKEKRKLILIERLKEELIREREMQIINKYWDDIEKSEIDGN